MTPLWLTLLLTALLAVFAAAQNRRPSPFGSANPAAEPLEETETAQPASARQTRVATNRAQDPFAEELKRAFEAEARWLALHEALMDDLDSLGPCGDQPVQRIPGVRDAAFEMFTQRVHYLQKHESYATEVLNKVQQNQTSLAVDRGELEASSRQIAQELDAARRRRAELASSLQAVDSSEENPSLLTLDQIIAKLEREQRLTEDTLREFDQSRQHLRAILRWARQRQRASRDQLELIKAESRLWKAFYDALALRLELACYQQRPNIYDFPTRSPRELKP